MQYTLIPRATHSLKLLCETPLFLLQLFQTLSRELHSEYVELVPLLVQVLSPAPTAEQLYASHFRAIHNQIVSAGFIIRPIRSRRPIALSLYSYPYVRRAQPQFARETCLDLLHVQVKTLSLLFYVQRYFPDTLVHYGEQLCAGIEQLFAHLLPEACNLRRDLLTTTRHFIQSEMKNSAPLLSTQKSCTPLLFSALLFTHPNFDLIDPIRSDRSTLEYVCIIVLYMCSQISSL